MKKVKHLGVMAQYACLLVIVDKGLKYGGEVTT